MITNQINKKYVKKKIVVLKNLMKLLVFNFKILELTKLTTLFKLEKKCSNKYLSPKKTVNVIKKNLEI